MINFGAIARSGSNLVRSVVDPNIDLIPGVGVPNGASNQQKAVNSVQGNRGTYWLNGTEYNSAGRPTGNKRGNEGTDTAGVGNSRPLTSGGAGGGGANNGIDIEAERAYLDDQEGLLRSILSRSGNLLNQGITQIGDDAARLGNKAVQDYARGKQDYGVKREDTQRSKLNTLNRVDTDARVQGNSVRNIISRASGSGSSALGVAGEAVARNASSERGDVMDTFGANFRDLALGEKRLEEDVHGENGIMADIARQKADKERGLREGLLTQEQGVHGQLADIARQRASLNGGNYASVRAASAPYQAEYNNRTAAIDNLFNQFRSPIQARQVNTAAPTLRDYTIDRAAAPVAGGGIDPSSPYSQFLPKQQDDDERLF